MVVTALGLLLGDRGRQRRRACRCSSGPDRGRGGQRGRCRRSRPPSRTSVARSRTSRVVLARTLSGRGPVPGVRRWRRSPRVQARAGGRAARRRAWTVRPAPAAPVGHPARGARPVRWTGRGGGARATYTHLHARLVAVEQRARRRGRARPRAGPRGRPAALRSRRGRDGRAAARRGRRSWRRRSPGSASPTPCARPPSRPERRSPARRAAPTRWRPRSAARRSSQGVREHDPEAGELADRLGEVTYLLSDVAADVASYAARLETDPARLSAVSDRRAALTGLTRKYGRDHRRGARLGGAGGGAAARAGRHRRTDRRSSAPSGSRCGLPWPRRPRGSRQRATEAGERLAAEVTAELALLAMPQRRPDRRRAADPGRRACGPGRRGGWRPLLVGDRWLRFTGSGVDDVEFLLAANAGAEPRPLGKGASGGELSRVMLAVEVSLAGTSPVPTFVFDEVDAGVGGAGRDRGRPTAGPAGPRPPRSWWSPTCPRWRRTPTGTSSWRRPATAVSPPPG